MIHIFFSIYHQVITTTNTRYYLQYERIQQLQLQYQVILILMLYHFLTGTLSNVTIMEAVPSTTDVKIALKEIPSNISRTIVGYERHDLGVTLQGEYANIGRRTEHTFSSLVPGASYTVVVQGLHESANEGQRSQHVTRRDVKTKMKGQGNIPFYLSIFISY